MSLQTDHGHMPEEDGHDRCHFSTEDHTEEAEKRTGDSGTPRRLSGARQSEAGGEPAAWRGWGWLVGHIVESWDHTLRVGFLLVLVLLTVAVIALVSTQWLVALSATALPVVAATTVLVRWWRRRQQEPGDSA